MWNPFKTKVVVVPTKSRIEIEDLIEQGFSCKEIAEELQITIEEVYRIKNAKQRRAWRAQTGEEIKPVGDRVSSLREELVAVELQDKIDEAKHRAFMRQQERNEYESDDIEELTEAADNPDKLLQTLLLNAVVKQQQTQQATNLNTTNSTPMQSTITATQPEKEGLIPHSEENSSLPSSLDFNQIEKGIKAGLITENMFIKEAAALKLTPDKAKTLYNFIKKKL